ncbi:NAD(P)H-dependent oxidoreductase [Vibrio coralliilyticus]|uniref:NAD(P)H-dependent oxidoreductase n=1 Tax=Vibrio TaxID=662 RepID=UPI000500354A|nr:MULTISPECIES: NAD(P)H-dependent oxidoreductase [Vibrio]KFI10701.1 NADPH-quinone reductase [Vibrio sp. B183]NOI20058.1 NAD(P)H-dependent oxidoreductase [Vibrio coralliilyticus]
MRVLVVFNHPYEGSYCNAILNSVTRSLSQSGHDVDLIHLDNEEFDPVIRAQELKAFALARKAPQEAQQLLSGQVMQYKERLEEAEHIVFIFPIWWELMPAMTKGFIDKLIFPSIAYNYKGESSSMYCTLSKLTGVTMITTMNTPSLIYRFLFGNAIKKAMLMGTFWKIGVKKRNWINFASVKSVSQEKRKSWLDDIEKNFASRL